MSDGLFPGARPRPVDEFRDELLAEDRAAQEAMTPEQIAAIEEADAREDELERREVANAVACPACYARRGEPCKGGELHYERRSRYAGF